MRACVGRMARCLAVVGLMVFGGGCAWTPVPVRLLSVEPRTALDQGRGEVTLVVRDARFSALRNSNIFGIKRNGYQIPTAPVFLAHTDTFDRIVARNTRPMLEAAGFRVVRTVPDISGEDSKREKPSEDKGQQKARFGDVRAEYDRQKDDVKEARASRGQAVDSDLAGTTVEGVGGSEAAPTPVTVEVKVRSLFADTNPAISWLWPIMHSWLIADVYVYSSGEGPRAVTFGRKVKSYTTAPWLAFDNGETAYNLTVNLTFRLVMKRIEDHFRSDAFRLAVAAASGQKQK